MTFHKINPIFEDQKSIGFCVGCYIIHSGDTFAKIMNAEFVTIETQTAMKKNGLPLPERVESIHDRPGMVASKIEELIKIFKPKD